MTYVNFFLNNKFKFAWQQGKWQDKGSYSTIAWWLNFDIAYDINMNLTS